jgi:hypothetical protein
MRKSDGQIEAPLGQNPEGILIYSPSGLMSVTLLKPGRRAFQKPGLADGTDSEMRSAFSSFVHYYGTFEEHDGYVMHRIERSLFPNWSETNQRRNTVFEGDELLLWADIVHHGASQERAEVRWRRRPTR